MATSEIESVPHETSIEFLERSAYERITVMVTEEVVEKSWVEKMTDFIEKGIAPKNEEKARMIKRSPRFMCYMALFIIISSSIH